MTKHCANPECGSEFKVFNGGALYALEQRTAATEFFWLCPACAVFFGLRLGSGGRPAVHDKYRFAGSQPPDRDRWLRMVFSPASATDPLNRARETASANLVAFPRREAA